MADKEPQQPKELPIVLVHRLPSYKIPLDPSFRDQLRSQFHMLDPHESPEPYDSFLVRNAPFIRVLMTIGYSPISAEFLERLPVLELIVATSAGLNHIDLPACWSRGIVVTNVSLAFAEDVADCAVGLLIDVLRRISAADRFARGRLWPVKENYPLGFKIIPFGPYENTVLNLELQLGDKRVGIVGLGSIGSEVAKRLLAFGCTIAYTSRNKKQSVSFPFYANVRDLAANRKDGVIINVGRGSLINEKELVQCLVGGEMGGAGLDVYENEPNVPKELFGLDNVVLSPHCAVMTPESFEALDQLIVVNLKAFFSNKPLVSVVSNE
ncbi:hypothetical protein Gotur_032856 [Gossypium turneri]